MLRPNCNSFLVAAASVFMAVGSALFVGCESSGRPSAPTRQAPTGAAAKSVSVDHAVAGLGSAFGSPVAVGANGRRHEVESPGLKVKITFEGPRGNVERITITSALEEKMLWST